MHTKIVLTALLASNLGYAAVLPRQLFDAELLPVGQTEDSTPALAIRADGLAVTGPQPHVQVPGTQQKSSEQKKSGKANKALQQGFIGGGNPGHSQHPANTSGQGQKSKSSKPGKSQAKKAKSGNGQPSALKAPANGGKAAVGSPASPSVSAAPSASAAPGGNSFTGDMTYYTPGLGSCGNTNTESDMIVALAADLMTGSANPNANPNCGRSITISYGGVTASATIEDTCPGCAGAGLDLTPALFQKFAPLGEGRLTGATWSFN